MQRELRKQGRNRRMTDEGFSLVEVLVCIAIVALVAIPLFRGIRVSATLNNKAHHTQKVTAYVQEELEIIKSISVEKYIADFGKGSANVVDGVSYTYIDSEIGQWADMWKGMNDRAQLIKADFAAPVSMNAEEEAALFTPFICEKKDVEIGGKEYTLLSKFMPAEYSRYGQTTAANVNVAGFYDVAEADAVRFPVISDEINLYDDTCVTSLITKLTEMGETKTEADITGNMKKLVYVTIDSAGTEVDVRCDVTYSYPAAAPMAEVSYCVYKTSYEVYPAAGADKGTESGGNVFLFARAFRGLDNECINELEIKSTGDTNVYFILGRRSNSDRFYNFNNIIINDAPYSTNYNVTAALVPGEMGIAGTNGMFYCNIKKNGENLVLSEGDKEQETIGSEQYKAVGYAVEIEMYDQEDDTRVAHVEATKVDR